MTETLTLNGQAVDMDTSAAVTLNFKSNLLGDIDAIDSSYSQTVTLPMTARNRQILDDPTRPAYRSGGRRARMRAEYSRNGVPVVRDAYAVVMDSSAGGYEVALYWGIRAALQSWLDADPGMGDLGWEPSVQPTAWSRSLTRTALASVEGTEGYQGFVWADYHCGIGNWNRMAQNDYGVFLHPFVSVLTLLELVAAEAGIGRWNVTDALKREMSLACVFLQTRASSVPVSFSTTSVENGLALTFGGTYASYFTIETVGGVSVMTVTQGGRATVSVTGSFTSWWDGFRLAVTRNGSEVGSRTLQWSSREEARDTEVQGTEIWRWLYTYEPAMEVSFDCSEGDEVSVVATGSIWGAGTLAVTFAPPVDSVDISLGERFRAMDNMPDISQLEFLKAVCAMYGMYVMPDGDSLQLCTLDALTGNRANAVDWTAKMIPSDVDGEPSEVAFSAMDDARRNWFRYKGSERVKETGAAFIAVDDDRLEEEADLVTLPWCASDTRAGDGLLSLPHYSAETDDEGEVTVDDEDIGDRVAYMEDDGTGYCRAAFAPLKWGSLLSHHSALAGILNDAVVITENLRLTEHDLLGLDYLRPVWLGQYGRHYGIVSIRTQDDGTCRAELLQLPLE